MRRRIHRDWEKAASASRVLMGCGFLFAESGMQHDRFDGETVKTVYSASNIALVSIFQNILDSHGFRCWIKNEFLSAGIGELPPIECWPQLCVDDEDFLEAKRIVEEALSEEDTPPWKCDSCGEEIEGQFAVCWNCGKVRSPDC